MDVRHFEIIDCSHLASGCTIDCGCIGLMLFHYLSVSCQSSIRRPNNNNNMDAYILL